MFQFTLSVLLLLCYSSRRTLSHSSKLNETMPDNEASRLLLSSKTPAEFVKNIIKLQTTPNLLPLYQQTIPYFYVPEAQFIRDIHSPVIGVDNILKIYENPPISSSVRHDFLMDPIVEESEESFNVAMTSNVKQQRLFENGKDYTYPLYLSLLLTKDLRIKRLLYNIPYYAWEEVPAILTRGQYLPNYYKTLELPQFIYSMWNGLKLISSDYNNIKYGELWRPYFSDKKTTKLLFQNNEYNGIDEIIKFHNDFAENIFGGYRFYIISTIGGKEFITVHMRGNAISADLKVNYNDNFRMIIEYKINANDEIIFADYKIDTEQFNEIKKEFDIKYDNSAQCKQGKDKCQQEVICPVCDA